MEKVWIVQGSTGEYSDHDEWVICAYRTQEQANTHAVLAAARAREIQKAADGEMVFSWDLERLGMFNEYDKDMRIDYTGVNYQVIEVELRDEGPIQSNTLNG